MWVDGCGSEVALQSAVASNRRRNGPSRGQFPATPRLLKVQPTWWIGIENHRYLLQHFSLFTKSLRLKPNKHCMAWRVEHKIAGEIGSRLPGPWALQHSGGGGRSKFLR